MIHNVYIELKKGRVSSYESRLNCCDEVMIYCISILVNISQCSNSQKCMPIGRTTNTFIFLLPYLLNNLVCLSSRHCSGSGDSVVTSWRHSSLKNRCHGSRSSRVKDWDLCASQRKRWQVNQDQSQFGQCIQKIRNLILSND